MTQADSDMLAGFHFFAGYGAKVKANQIFVRTYSRADAVFLVSAYVPTSKKSAKPSSSNAPGTSADPGARARKKREKKSEKRNLKKKKIFKFQLNWERGTFVISMSNAAAVALGS